jgi:hypothetical protein
MAESATQADPEAEEDALAAVSSQVKRLIARLVPPKGEDPTDQTPLQVELTAPRRNIPAYVSSAPYHVESEEEPLPGEADAFLQIWELDRIRVNSWGTNADGDTNDASNRLVASIPGIVVRKDSSFGFRALGEPVPARSEAPTKGSLLLELDDAEGSPKEFQLWLPEHESQLELVCVLRSKVNDSAMEDVTTASGILQVGNVQGSARRQIEEEGGLTLAFVADYDTSNARNDVKQRNDAEFARQAAGLLGTRASFVVKDGTLSLGYTLVSGSDEIASVCEEVSCAVASALELSEPPKVATLLLFGHGTRTKLQLNPAGYNACGSIQPKACEDLVTALESHLADEVTVALFACNNARGARAGGSCGKSDGSYGHAYVGEIPGVDSLGWKLFKSLTADGSRKATVWGHTTSGHTTRNSLLRVFSSWGVADFASLLLGARNLTNATRSHYVTRFSASFSSQSREVALSRLRNGNRLRALSALSGRYLPWSALGGQDSDPSDPKHNAAAADHVTRVVDDLRSLLAKTAVQPEPWSFEDATQRVITGRDPEVQSTEPLAPHFTLQEFTRAELGSPLRLELSLLQALELLRVRGRSALKIEALLEGGARVRLNLAKDRRESVLEKAQAMVEEGLLSEAKLVAERLFVSVGRLEYDEELTWVTGCREPSELVSESRVTRSIPWEALGNVSRARRTLLQAGQHLIDRGASLGGISADGLKLRLTGPSEALVDAAQELLCSGWIDAIEAREDGIQLECLPEGSEACSE